jgi:GT2 family glycosyltransferase
MPGDSPQSSPLPMADDAPHPGCNCGRHRAAPPPAPLLTRDLVIAARDRAREPELPAATLERALATPIAPRLARYDVVILAGSPDQAERETRIAAEFGRHEYRVFHLVPETSGTTRKTAPAIHRIPIAETASLRDEDVLRTLGDLRRSEAIETAVFIAPAMLDPAIAADIRRRFNWRLVTASDAPAPLRSAANVVIEFDAPDHAADTAAVVALPASLSWPARWAALDRAFRAAWPRASVIVLTHDNLAFNRMCLASILENTAYPNYELIVVDNASTDGTAAELTRLTRDVPHVRAILNDHNAGFGPGNNRGLAAATGDLLVLLNNDTVVPPGWLTRLGRHLEDPALGLIGPATNRTCNEAQHDIPYQTYGEYLAVARTQGERHEGARYPIRMPMFFCVAFRRDTYERLGPLDERYEVGMFEDEDYALRAKEAGLETAWTPEVYVHHAYHASIGKLLPTGEYMRLVKLNQGRFEEKWGICWERHRPLPAPPPAA